jgi:hypothetical protein
MKTYIGTKIIQATPESKGPLPHGEEGYAVVYEDGYRSWSPKAAFEAAYRECDAMPFGLAIEALKKGFKVARAGWNGKGMWLVLASGWNAQLQGTYTTHALNMPDDWVGYAPFIAMFTADKVLVPWLASQTDMLAEDWSIV